MLKNILVNSSYIDKLFIPSLSRLRAMLLYLLSCRYNISHPDTLQDRGLCGTGSKVRLPFKMAFPPFSKLLALSSFKDIVSLSHVVAKTEGIVYTIVDLTRACYDDP